MGGPLDAIDDATEAAATTATTTKHAAMSRETHHPMTMVVRGGDAIGDSHSQSSRGGASLCYFLVLGFPQRPTPRSD